MRSRLAVSCGALASLTSLFLAACGPSPSFESVEIGQTGVNGAGQVSVPVPPGV